MKLAYGRFDPDLTPLQLIPSDFGVIEIDLFSYFLWKPGQKRKWDTLLKKRRFQIIPRISLRNLRDQEEIREMLEEWNRLFSEHTLYRLIHSGRRAWQEWGLESEIRKLTRDHHFFFEWGKDDDLGTTRFLTESPMFGGFVVDPSWHVRSLSRLKSFPIHFKLHGWHELRWVRRYGPTQASQIIKFIRRSSHQQSPCLTLSYSGKTEEVRLFMNFVESSFLKSS